MGISHIFRAFVLFFLTVELCYHTNTTGSLCCSPYPNGSNFYEFLKVCQQYCEPSCPQLFYGNKRIPEKPALSSPSCTQIISTSILDSLFAGKSIKVCYSGCTETALLAAQKKSKEGAEIGNGQGIGNKMLWGWSGDIEVGHRNRHGKKIHEFVENQNFLSNFEPSRRTVTSLFSTVSFEHVGASLWCLHCNEKYTSVFHLYFWLSLHSLFLPLTLPIFLTAFLCLFPSCCLTVVET